MKGRKRSAANTKKITLAMTRDNAKYCCGKILLGKMPLRKIFLAKLQVIVAKQCHKPMGIVSSIALHEGPSELQ
ncbi:hypothetical protein [Bartonella sp. B1099]|uniref:hypothetical protein n=1 Tax=Bartonella sp. B1099 TaxID=2911422 RepID=UPI0020C24A6F|nr:hypothetical protein [Bartonella sp. B1099]